MADKYGVGRLFDLVSRVGSGSVPEDVAAAVDYSVVKMNVDTDTQYAFTRPVAEHMLRNDDSLLNIDGEVGNKNDTISRLGLAAQVG